MRLGNRPLGNRVTCDLRARTGSTEEQSKHVGKVKRYESHWWRRSRQRGGGKAGSHSDMVVTGTASSTDKQQ